MTRVGRNWIFWFPRSIRTWRTSNELNLVQQFHLKSGHVKSRVLWHISKRFLSSSLCLKPWRIFSSVHYENLAELQELKHSMTVPLLNLHDCAPWSFCISGLPTVSFQQSVTWFMFSYSFMILMEVSAQLSRDSLHLSVSSNLEAIICSMISPLKDLRIGDFLICSGSHMWYWNGMVTSELLMVDQKQYYPQLFLENALGCHI